MRKKTVGVTLLILMSVAFFFMPLSLVLGQLGVNIYLVSPQGQGVVSQNVNLQGTINTKDGEYQIWFGNKLVVSNNSEGFYVNANFAIPALPRGDYSIILRDFAQNVNATQEFSISTAYNIEALVPSAPAQLQEGNDVVLNVTLTGGQPDTEYYANITVILPAPLNTNYSKLITLSSSTQTGTAQAQLTYPDPTFQPEGSLTDFAGSYQVYFNKTQQLAIDQFSVGFTDLSVYHRSQSMAMRAIGYQPNENAAISITYAETGVNVHSEAVTASSEGIINANWTVPSNAVIGDYNITITPQNTPKLIPDSQLFTVPGYPVKVRTLNLAGDIVSLIVVEALDQAASTRYNSTSGNDGIASINLERGNHTISAFWNGVKVGEIPATITGAGTFDLQCELTNLKITVQDKNGNLISFVNLDITYQYVTTKESLSKTGSDSGQTDLSGTFTLNSTLAGISYTINASIYGLVFNIKNNSISVLPAQPISGVLVLCPSQNLTLTVLDYSMVAIPDTRIEMAELTSGLFYGVVTDNSGIVAVEVTFGKYRLRVYKENILLNETVVEVFSDTQHKIRCSLYNIQVWVTVIDYFAQPIPNINVQLNGPGIGTQTAITQIDGTTTFSDIIGGNIQIIAYPAGMENSYEAVNLQIKEPTAIQIKMAKYILLGPFLIESSVLATFIIIFAAILLFLSLEIYRRKRIKPANRES
ncbi:MAG: hypothetical protein JSW44_04035 [Candidatus Bathyarchaeota archaeon]|nr:MAG: hypothetical protein JSW44_04035 [Candidatus Bathyarchaeota archaeon]